MWPSRYTTERHPLPLEQSQLAREARFLPILLTERHLPERRVQIQRREELRVPQLRKALIDAGNRVCVLYCHCVQVTEITTKPELPPFFLAITTPQAHRDFDGSIMSYSINISISFLNASDLCGSFSSPLPYEAPSPLLSQSRVLQSCSNLCRPYDSKKRLHSDLAPHLANLGLCPTFYPSDVLSRAGHVYLLLTLLRSVSRENSNN